MKNVIIINLSPRKKGTSDVLANMCTEYLENLKHHVEYYNLYEDLKDRDHLYSSISNADTVILCGPCYVNSFPADTIGLLEDLIKHKHILHGQNLYGIIQGGMPYVHTHESGIKSLELFCEECDMQFKGGFVMGLGALLNGQSIDKLPNRKNVKRQFDIFLDHVEKCESSPRAVYEKAQIKMPGFIWRILAKRMNKSIDKELRKQGIDSSQLSPYLNE